MYWRIHVSQKRELALASFASGDRSISWREPRFFLRTWIIAAPGPIQGCRKDQKRNSITPWDPYERRGPAPSLCFLADSGSGESLAASKEKHCGPLGSGASSLSASDSEASQVGSKHPNSRCLSKNSRVLRSSSPRLLRTCPALGKGEQRLRPRRVLHTPAEEHRPRDLALSFRSLYLSVCLSIFLSVWSVCLSACLSGCPSLSVCLP